MQSAKATPPNSLVLIIDSAGGSIPETMNGQLVAATKSCIAVGCRADVDGPTEIFLEKITETAALKHLAFQGSVATPSHTISVKSVVGETILECTVDRTETMVRVWTNSLDEPDQILIGLE